MSDKKMAFMVTEEMASDIDNLKKEQYYDKPYSDLLRDVVAAGLKALKKKGDK